MHARQRNERVPLFRLSNKQHRKIATTHSPNKTKNEEKTSERRKLKKQYERDSSFLPFVARFSFECIFLSQLVRFYKRIIILQLRTLTTKQVNCFGRFCFSSSYFRQHSKRLAWFQRETIRNGRLAVLVPFYCIVFRSHCILIMNFKIKKLNTKQRNMHQHFQPHFQNN